MSKKAVVYAGAAAVLAILNLAVFAEQGETNDAVLVGFIIMSALAAGESLER